MKKMAEKYEWDNSRIVLVCGSGGVGKTTISAAIAVDYAKKGYKTLVLTIDPAKRLAQALGLSSLSSDLKKVKINGCQAGGSLDAMMLDTKRTFDSIIEKYAPDKSVRDTVLKHPLYCHLSNMLAGSQEYMAMENLYQLANEHDYEKIIVDTPPATHALDFLDAPEKMVNALTNSMLKLIIKPSIWAGKKGGKWFKFGTEKFMSVFGDMAGIQFLNELADFLMSTISLLDGFKERAADVMRLIASSDVSLILVSAPRPSIITDASEFIREIEKRNLRFEACIVNRVSKDILENHGSRKDALVWIEKQKDKKIAEIKKYVNSLIFIRKLEEQLIKDLKGKNKKTKFYRIPAVLKPIHNIGGLKSLIETMKII